MILRQALDRTLRLMWDELEAATPADTLITALTGDRGGDRRRRREPTSRTRRRPAYVTAALLMARSGHRVLTCSPRMFR